MKILLVEDNRDTANSMAVFLRLTNHEVIVANSFIEGRNLAQLNDFDAAIIDWWLYPDTKGGSGVELIKWLRENKYRQPIALITGADICSIRELMNTVQEYLKVIVVQKPIEADKLVEKLRILI